MDTTTCFWATGGRVHRGFGYLLMRIRDLIEAVVRGIDQLLYDAGHDKETLWRS